MSDDDIIKLAERKDNDQFTPKDAAEWFLRTIKTGNVERCLILYKEKTQDNCSFVQGSVLGNYTVADVNWDVDQFKRLHLAGEYEPVEEE
jgi:hypothetical protein